MECILSFWNVQPIFERVMSLVELGHFAYFYTLGTWFVSATPPKVFKLESFNFADLKYINWSKLLRSYLAAFGVAPFFCIYESSPLKLLGQMKAILVIIVLG